MVINHIINAKENILKLEKKIVSSRHVAAEYDSMGEFEAFIVCKFKSIP